MAAIATTSAAITIIITTTGITSGHSCSGRLGLEVKVVVPG